MSGSGPELSQLRQDAIERLDAGEGHSVVTLSLISHEMQQQWNTSNPGSRRVIFASAFQTNKDFHPNVEDFEKYIAKVKKEAVPPQRVLIPLGLPGHACGLIVDIDETGKANILFFNPMGEIEGSDSFYRSASEPFVKAIQKEFPGAKCKSAKARWQCEEYQYCGDWTMWYLNQAGTTKGGNLPNQEQLMNASRGIGRDWKDFANRQREKNKKIIAQSQQITFEIPTTEQAANVVSQMGWSELDTDAGRKAYKAYLEDDRLPYRRAEIAALTEYIQNLDDEIDENKDGRLNTLLSQERINAGLCIELLEGNPIDIDTFIVARTEGIELAAETQKRRNELAGQAKPAATGAEASGSPGVNSVATFLSSGLRDADEVDRQAKKDRNQSEMTHMLSMRQRREPEYQFEDDDEEEVKEKGKAPSKKVSQDFYNELEVRIKSVQVEDYKQNSDVSKQEHFESKINAILDELNKWNPKEQGDKDKLNAFKSMLLSMQSLSRNQVRYTEAHFNKRVDDLMSGAPPEDKERVKKALSDELKYYFYNPQKKPGQKRKSADFSSTAGDRVFPKDLKTQPGVKIEHKKGGKEVIGTFGYSRGKVIGDVLGIGGSPKKEYEKFRKQIVDFANVAIDEYGKGTERNPIKIYFTGKEERPEAAFALIIELKRRAILEGKTFHAVYENPPGNKIEVKIEAGKPPKSPEDLSAGELGYLKHFANKKPKIGNKEMKYSVGSKLYQHAGLGQAADKNGLSDPEIQKFFNATAKPKSRQEQGEEQPRGGMRLGNSSSSGGTE